MNIHQTIKLRDIEAAGNKIETPSQQSIEKPAVPTKDNKQIVKKGGKVTSHSMNWRKKSEVDMTKSLQ